MLNDPKERIKKRCPGCAHWGKAHALEIATKKDICTIRLMDNLNIEEVANKCQESDAARVVSWRDCAELSVPKPEGSFLKRLSLFKRRPKRYCPMCGAHLKPGSLGSFCSLACAEKFMNEEEKKNEQRTTESRG